jgi:hypothetical protein
VVFPHADEQPGDELDVRIERVNSATLIGVRAAEPVRSLSIKESAA